MNTNTAKSLLKDGDYPAAFDSIIKSVGYDDSFQMQFRAAKILASIPMQTLDLQPMKVALVANSSVDHFADILQFWLASIGIAAEIYITPFNSMVQSVLDSSSELYSFKPDLVWLFSTYRDVQLDVAAGTAATAVRKTVEEAVAETIRLWKPLFAQLNCIVLQNNADIPAQDPFGNMAGAAIWGGRNTLRLYNAELSAAIVSGVVIFDLDHIAALHGKSRWVDDRYWFYSKHAFSFDAVGLVAHTASRVIAAAKGLAKKCLVLDLDNTLWGGIIGDDGINGITLGSKAEGEAYVAFQEYVRDLKQRGIVLAICSKNETATAKEPFEQHPDMQLQLSDIAVFRANWDSKTKNLQEIASILNIGIDSLVFVDDNPAERDIVRQYLPMVDVPELPDDPADYINVLARGCYFETVSFSPEDKERARYYQENAQRTELQHNFKSVDMGEFLASLEMVCEIGSIDKFHLPRLAQLINKSNQFHLTGTRYSETDLLALSRRQDYVIRYFKLRDRFGDHGLISAVLLLKIESSLHIDTWVMSCRVLSRSMEEFICMEILNIAKACSCDIIIGRYIATKKNKLVSDLYARLGFEPVKTENKMTIWKCQACGDVSKLRTYVSLDRQLDCVNGDL